jgi:hypothetical protein
VHTGAQVQRWLPQDRRHAQQHLAGHVTTLDGQHRCGHLHRDDDVVDAGGERDDDAGREGHLRHIAVSHPQPPPQREEHQLAAAQRHHRVGLGDATVDEADVGAERAPKHTAGPGPTKAAVWQAEVDEGMHPRTIARHGGAVAQEISILFKELST